MRVVEVCADQDSEQCSQYLAAYCVENPTDYGCSLARPVFERLTGEEVNVTVHARFVVKSAFLQAKARPAPRNPQQNSGIKCSRWGV